MFVILIFLYHYILCLQLVFLLIFWIYIKIKYPFWSSQPLFHTYDYFRKLQKSPFLVSTKVVSTKYYKPENIQTFEYLQCDEKKINKFIDFIQCNYNDSDNILLLNDKKNYLAFFFDQTYPTLISFYQEKIKTLQMENTIVLGCIISRFITISFETNILPTFFLDYLCIHKSCKEKQKQTILYNLIQTHEHNQREKNPTIHTSLIKQKKKPFDGIIPLVKYHQLLYYLPESIKKVDLSLPYQFTCVAIQKENSHLLFDFLEKSNSIFRFTAISNFMKILYLINNEEIYVYCLCKGSHVYAYYFFKNSQKQYDHIGNVLEFIGSYNNTRSTDLFYQGFIYALNTIRSKNDFKILLFENISHNSLLIERMTELYSLLLKEDTYYYLYNYIIPLSPLNEKECFFLL